MNTIQSTEPIDTEKTKLMVEMAHLYYEENLTQAEIAGQLKVSKATVSRFLKDAIRKGVVEVIIHDPLSSDWGLAKALTERFGLKEAHVLAEGASDYKGLVDAVGRLAARVLKKHLRDDMTMAISLGQAVAATVDALQISEPIHVRIASTHGQSDVDLIEGSSVLRKLAQKLGNDVRIIPSPLLLKNESICQVIRQEHAVHEVLAIAEQADLALVGIGAPISEISALLLNKYVKPEDLQYLTAEGAVGDVCAVQFDADGNVLDVELNRRTVTIDIRRLREIPITIGVAAGMPKVQAILGALHGHYVNVLVTDAGVARLLLEEGSQTFSNVASPYPGRSGENV
jgi:deoxyribonucleoside regulator